MLTGTNFIKNGMSPVASFVFTGINKSPKHLMAFMSN